MELQIYILPIAALILSGLVWNNFGYFSAWRKNHNNKDWKGFEKSKLRNDLILGAILGGGTIVYTIIAQGELTAINTAQEFLVAIGAGFGLVAMVDKFIIGGILKK